MRVPNRQLPLCESPCCEEVKDLSKRDPNIIQMWDPLKKAMEDVRIAGTVSISDTFSKLRFFINRLFTLVRWCISYWQHNYFFHKKTGRSAWTMEELELSGLALAASQHLKFGVPLIALPCVSNIT